MHDAARDLARELQSNPEGYQTMEQAVPGPARRRFIFWDVLGEILWVVLYVMLGYVFSDRVQFISEIMGNLAWAILAFVIASILGWKLFRYFRPSAAASEAA